MSIRLGILMDPIGAIKVHKDSSFAMLLGTGPRLANFLYGANGSVSAQ